LFAKSATWGYGASGTRGFQNVMVRNRFHETAHSSYFDANFVTKYWVPYIANAAVVDSDWELTRPEPPMWHTVIEKAPLRWVLLVAAFLLIGTVGTGSVAGVRDLARRWGPAQSPIATAPPLSSPQPSPPVARPPMDRAQALAQLAAGTQLQRLEAAQDLLRSGEGTTQELDAWIRALRDPEPSVRALAAEALGKVGGKDVPGILVTSGVRKRATTFTEAVKGIATFLKPSGEPFSLTIGEIELPSLSDLKRSPRLASPAVYALDRALEDEASEVRLAAARALGTIENSIEVAEPRLKTLGQSDPDETTRLAAWAAVRRIRERQPRRSPPS
jgi:hypothetical protein